MSKNLTKRVITSQPFLERKVNFNRKIIGKGGISQIYEFTTGDNDIIPIGIPDACIDLISYWNRKKGTFQLYLVGPTYSYDINYISFEANSCYTGIRFEPGYPIKFGALKQSDVIGKIINLSEIMNYTDILAEQIHKVKDMNEKVKLFECLLEKKDSIQWNSRDNLQCFLANSIIDYASTLNLSDLEMNTGYSKFYMNKVFRERTGYTIMDCYHVMRIHKLLNYYNISHILKEKVNLIDVAQMIGFSDQSHMSREFKKYIGVSPKKYLISQQ